MGVDGFTPPLWGKYEVANITSYSRLGLGAYLAALSVGLLVIAFYYRDTTTRFGDLPTEAAAVPGRVRATVGGVLPGTGGGDGEESRDRPANRSEGR
jgi:hypothetical protein